MAVIECRKSTRLLVLLISLVVVRSAVFGVDKGELRIYSQPSDLSKVENLSVHHGKRYKVEVNGRPVPVYSSNGNYPSKIKTIWRISRLRT